MQRVLIVEDHSSSVWATRHIIEESLPTVDVTVCVTAEATLKELDSTPAWGTWHRVLLDLDVPGARGLSLAREFMKRRLGPVTCIITGNESQELSVAAKEMGFLGYILKGLPWEDYKSALGSVFAGHRTFTHGQSARAVESIHLTRRQTEALAYVQRGYSGKQLADALGCSAGTAKNHVDSAMRALGVKTRAQAVAHAIQIGLLDLASLHA